jgi:hypothetical protein
MDTSSEHDGKISTPHISLATLGNPRRFRALSMAFDPASIDTSALKARVAELRRFL